MSRTCKSSSVIESLETRTLMSGSPLGVTEVAYNGGTQLRIIATSNNAQITLKETAAGLVVANGSWSKTITDTINNLWIDAQGSNNSVELNSTVTMPATLIAESGKTTLEAGSGTDTLVCLGSTSATLVGGKGMDTFWADNTASEKIQGVTSAELSLGSVHRVGSFINASSMTVSGKKVSSTKSAITAITTGSIKEPAVDAGVTYSNFSNDPIFASTGPSANDIFQGDVGDCYFLSVLSSVAKIDPARITSSILDLGNGTVIVALDKNGKQVFVHEDEQLPVSSGGTLYYAGLGQQNCTWVALMEKAFTYVRTNQVSYASINAGWMDEAYETVGVANPTSTYSAPNASVLATAISQDLAAGQSVTYATDANPDTSTLVAGHAYMVDSVGLDSHGKVTTITLRNPWGCDANGNGNGYVTVTPAQLFASMTGMVSANV